MQQIDQLKDFISKAVRNYKYTASTGSSLSKAVDLFGDVLQGDEKESLQLLVDRADNIANRIDVKYPNKYTASSLMTYKSRVLRAVSDYTKYGLDAKAMNNWQPKAVSKRSPAEKSNESPGSTAKTRVIIDAEELPVATSLPTFVSSSTSSFSARTQNIDLPLLNDRSVTINYPVDLTVAEAEKISNILKAIAALGE